MFISTELFMDLAAQTRQQSKLFIQLTAISVLQGPQMHRCNFDSNSFIYIIHLKVILAMSFP
jgi:hypothetical protein